MVAATAQGSQLSREVYLIMAAATAPDNGGSNSTGHQLSREVAATEQGSQLSREIYLIMVAAIAQGSQLSREVYLILVAATAQGTSSVERFT